MMEVVEGERRWKNKMIQQARLVTGSYQETVPCLQLWESAKSMVKWTSELDATTEVGQTEVRTGCIVSQSRYANRTKMGEGKQSVPTNGELE